VLITGADGGWGDREKWEWECASLWFGGAGWWCLVWYASLYSPPPPPPRPHPWGGRLSIVGGVAVGPSGVIFLIGGTFN
jgi:hypothetical protein